MSLFRHKVIKYVTDRPGEVLYRTEIADEIGLNDEQVAAVIRQFKADSPIGNEVEVVVRGHAWRYVPGRVVDVPTSVEPARDTSRPLTTLIYEYMVSHPHTVVSIDDLVVHTGRTVKQVQTGVNNMRSSYDVDQHLVILVAGQLWRYDPPGDVDRRNVRAVTSNDQRTTDRPTRNRRSSVTSTATVAPVSDDDVDDRDDRDQTFRMVGTSGNAVIIEDRDGVLYRAVQIN